MATLPKNIVLFSTADWDNPFWTNKQHTATQFAKNGYKVLYVDSLGLRHPCLNKKDIRRITKRLKKSFPWPKKIQPGIWRVSPLVLPWHGNKIVRGINQHILWYTLGWHMSVLGMRRPLIWTYNPVIANLCQSLPHSGIIYHCVDDLTSAPLVDKDAIQHGESALGAIADICFVTSPNLEKRMTPLFKKVVFEPNVCDFDHFSKARKPQKEPEALVGIPHPRLLFVGALSAYKVDFSLMEQVARCLPEVQWVLVGQRGEGQPGSLAPPTLDNIHCIGPQNYQNLPAFLANADAAVLPAPINEYTTSMFPMKFFEYLASGLPVIATPLPALKNFSDLCFLAGNATEFTDSINQVLNGKRRNQQQIDAACLHHSWEARFLRMQNIVEKALNKPR